MSADSLLQVLRAILADHERDHGHGLRVIPVVDEDLAQDHDVINLVMRRAGGDYINCDAIIDAEVDGVLDPDLAFVVERALKAASLPFAVVLEESGDLVRARLDTSQGPELPFNKSQRSALAVVASIFWSGFHQGHSIGAISFAEAEWDIATFRALWELLVAQLHGRRVGTLETLVVVSAGPFKTIRHCATDSSVRYVVKDGRFNVRKRPSDLEAALSNLVSSKSKHIVIFLGAGFSYSSEMPLGNEARDYALQQFFTPGRYAEAELFDKFFEWVVDNDRLLDGEDAVDRDRFVATLTLERVLREEFFRKRREDSPTLDWLVTRNRSAERVVTTAKASLERLVATGMRIVIFTVNFDTLLEAALSGRLNVMAGTAEFAAAAAVISNYVDKGGKIPYVKLHGTLGDRKSIVADVESTALGLPSSAIDAIRAAAGNAGETPWIYVGYSMRDADVSQVLALEWLPARAMESWVDPLPPPSIRAFANQYRSARWKLGEVPDIQQRCITETADRFLLRLSEVWPGAR